MNRASGVTVSPGTSSRDIIIVGICLGEAPRCGVSVDRGAAVVEDSHVVKGEGAGRSRSRAVIGDAACTADIVKLFVINPFWPCL